MAHTIGGHHRLETQQGDVTERWVSKRCAKLKGGLTCGMGFVGRVDRLLNREAARNGCRIRTRCWCSNAGTENGLA